MLRRTRFLFDGSLMPRSPKPVEPKGSQRFGHFFYTFVGCYLGTTVSLMFYDLLKKK